MDSATPIGFRLLSLLGIAVFVGLGWLISVDRKAIRWKPVFWGVGLQFIFGVIVLHPSMQDFFFWCGEWRRHSAPVICGSRSDFYFRVHGSP